MKKKIIIFIFASACLCALFFITKNFFSFFDREKEKTYTLLTIYDSDENPQLKKAFIFFFRYPKPYLLFFSIDDNVMTTENATMINILTGSKATIKKRIKKIYGYTVDYVATPSSQQIKSLLKILKGDLVFNLHSSAFKKGEIFIDHSNYASYLQGIKNKNKKEDAKRAFWYQNLDNYRKKAIEYKDYKKNLKKIYKNLAINATWSHFRALTDPLFQENTEIFFHSLRANLEFFTIGRQKYLIPYKDGKYDRKRIKEKLLLFENQDLNKIYFPIVLQIRNTTKINRLAARTTGILRLKRIDVLEYRNSSIPTKNSVLLDYSLSPAKREYLKKVTRIEKIYPAFDYQKKFDFSMYIAEDYYAVDLIRKKRSEDPRDLQKYIEIIRHTLSESKAENVAMYDVSHKKTYCDFVIIATGNSTLHLKALYEKVKKNLKEKDFSPYNPSKSIGENYWHILDYTDIVVHFFLQENRDYYKIDDLFEKMQNDQENSEKNFKEISPEDNETN